MSFQQNAITAAMYPAAMRFNLNAGLSHGDWDASVWVQNVTNRQDIVSNQESGLLGARVIYSTPRTIGVNVSYTFK